MYTTCEPQFSEAERQTRQAACVLAENALRMLHGGVPPEGGLTIFVDDNHVVHDKRPTTGQHFAEATIHANGDRQVTVWIFRDTAA